MRSGWTGVAAAAVASAAVVAGCGGSDSADTASRPSVTVSVPSDSVPTVSSAPPVATAPPARAGTSPGQTGGPEVQAVRSVLDRYVAAFVAADGATACALLTEESAEAFLDAVGSTVGASTCADAFTAVTNQLPAEQRAAFRGAVIRDVVIEGDTAGGILTVAGVSNDLNLVRRDGQWRIANLPGQ